MNKKNNRTLYITESALIAALYTVLTIFINTFNLAGGIIQLRISEALTVLPYFTSAAIPGLFIGCIIGNIVTGSLLPDVIFGSLATLLGAFGTFFIRKKTKNKWLAPVSPIMANTLIIPFILRYVYGFSGILPYFILTVGIGEFISAGILGSILLNALNPFRNIIFKRHFHDS